MNIPASQSSKENKNIYNIVLNYCKEKGYIEALKKSLAIAEGKRFDNKKINNVGLDILDAVHCVTDKTRTKFFLSCINKIVKKNDIVIEAGIGTGILSFASASKGAKVYGIELNKNIFNLTKRIKSVFFKSKIISKKSLIFLQNNAITYKPLEKADVLISENIYTGMFYEKQVQIMNNLVKYLKNGGVTIPSQMITGAILVNVKFPYLPKDKELFVLNEHKNGLNIQTLSQSVIYDDLNFYKKNKLQVDQKIKLKAVKNGEVNAVLIWSKVFLPDGQVIDRADTNFLNNDIVIYLSDVKKIKKGDIINLSIKYRYGGKPQEGKFILS